jgi:hypothetical protein
MDFSPAGCDNVEIMSIGVIAPVPAKNPPGLRDRRRKRRSLEQQLLQDLFGRSRTVALTRDASAGRGRGETAIAVVGRGYVGLPFARALFATLSPGGVFVDVKSALNLRAMPTGVAHWSL